MQYTHEQSAGFKTEFARRRKRQLLATIPLLVVVLAIAMGSGKSSNQLFGLPVTIWGPVAAAVFIGTFAFAFQNWRCPACNKYLGKDWGPRFCPKCGVALSGPA
jgi:hypothetical protein